MSTDSNRPTEIECPIVIAGIACRVPGADSVEAFADLLFHGRTGYGDLPADRCNRDLYFDPQKGSIGKSYTTLGGFVPERQLNRDVCPMSPQTERLHDITHVQFAEVAATAWRNAELLPNDQRLQRTGIYVGHSGGTKSGGALSLGTQIEEALSFVDDLESFRQLPAAVRREIFSEVAQAIRSTRPSRRAGAVPGFHAYHAASLAACVLGLTGPRQVIDAACASSLVALNQAILAIRAGRIDSAVVGGATYNNIDNLILFSHSQACTAKDSRPFDDNASGLVSSEGYVAIVITTRDLAIKFDLPMLGVIRGVGMASDGKGRSLWAPRMEGQVLALQRAYDGSTLLDIDYMEAHATSTQLGDATELETLKTLAAQSPAFPPNRSDKERLLLGSVKSNIGHTLEAAGLIGVVKVLLAMQRRQIPPSLRFEQPNHNYDWNSAPVRVVSQAEAWPERALHRRPRRAAVSAFGIGGLNAHAIVEEISGELTLERLTATSVSGKTHSQNSAAAPEPIAIVGRGIVVAGARNLSEFKSLLESNRSAITDAPSDRWRNRSGVADTGSPQTHQAPHCRGGFVTDFAFDGARYRIPPKQVQQANPLQMMLLDAVSQALADVGSNSEAIIDASLRQQPTMKSAEPAWPFDRQRTGVVIGAVFGNEFGDQLQVGMRLPEICGQLSASMSRRGLPSQLAKKVADDFRQTVLKNRPALLDETGSFTASTLASRVAKTFDLMGGACALDGEDTSGLAAVAVAADQLRSGACDMIVCGSAQRSMTLSAYEALDMTGQLVRSGRTEDVPENCRQIIPGEGVVTLLLCRLSDAQRLNLPIHGILDEIGQTRPTPAATAIPHNELSTLTSADAAIVRKIGYLSGAHSLVRIAAETLQPDRVADISNPISSLKDSRFLIAAKTVDGVVMQGRLQVPPRPPKKVPLEKSPTPSVQTTLQRQTQPTSQIPSTMISQNTKPDLMLQVVKFAAGSGPLLLQLFRDSISRVEEIFAAADVVRNPKSNLRSATGFQSDDIFRAVILASNADHLRDRLSAAIKATEAGRFRTILDRERVILWQLPSDSARVAWLFPGQGSHYAEAPAVLSVSEIARKTLESVDELYASSNLPRLSTAFGNPAIKPGEDVWWAQAWVLGVSAALVESLKAEGLRPDAVLGHSFGEFTASLASNVTTLPQTIELARHRANAVVSHMRTAGGLLSVRAAVHEVDAILKSAALPVYVTHLNSPKQTVIAGSREGILAAKALLDRQGLAAMSISVPAPFHTPLLTEAEVAFERMSACVPMRPPVCGFLSATSVQYLAEPSGIRNSLVRQLTQPVMYMPSIQRMLGEGFRVFLEVGPNDVLTRMNRDIVDSQALCLSLDVPGQPFAERLAMVHAVHEIIGTSPQLIRRTQEPIVVPSHQNTENSASALSAEASVFDVTRSRRSVRKAELNGESNHLEAIAPPSTPVFSQSATAPQQVHTPTTQSVSSNSAGVSDEQLRLFTRDLVVELTGYAPDIVDFDADLEADLGIDSIKKAQILGELGEWLGLTMRPDSLRLDSVKTLDDAVRIALEIARNQAISSAATPKQQTPISLQMPDADVRAKSHGAVEASFRRSELNTTPAATRSVNAEPSNNVLPSNDKLDALLIDYVVDQTGYARDVVDVDADLEADLGLDSIKLAQLIGEMRDQFNLESVTLESIAQARFRTLRGIREFLVQHAGGPQQTTVSSAIDSLTSPPQSLPVSQTIHAESSSSATIPEANGWSSNATFAAPNGVVAIRGVEPRSDIHPEWFGSTGRSLHSVDDAVLAGARLGNEHREEIRSALRSLVQRPMHAVAERNWTDLELAHIKGIANGAGVAEPTVRLAASIAFHRSQRVTDDADDQNVSEVYAGDNAENARPDDQGIVDPASNKTHRFALRVVSAPRRTGMPLKPELHGAALILGSNSVAEELADQIRQMGQQAIVLNTAGSIAQIEHSLTDLWQTMPTPHLFLTMAFDGDASQDLSEAGWKSRRAAALETPFRICQLWMQRTIEAKQMEHASVVSVTRLGGDFGFSGQNVRSIEAIGGLVKAMLIECWMRGYRTTPMKIVDAAPSMTPHEVACGLLQELAVPSYDMEIAFRPSSDVTRPERLCVQAIAAPLKSSGSRTRLTRGGTWVVTGGGRGITAVIAMTLARKYELRLHLLGTAPVPDLSDEFVRAVVEDRSGVRRGIMQDASARGENPVEAWRNVEKAIEVDATLRECRKQGVAATYHSCDVSDFADVDSTLRRIRQQAGSIHGVIHGAGAGQDARFDRKRPDKVEKCLKAKIDGSLAMMQATKSDPLEWFVTFGSISGRFGANGHTDYSLANDMMAKIVDRYRNERPDVRSLTFHWHAWGDIGMATKPEAKLALEMIDMEFMPARDGIAHFMNELEFGGDEPEVLITDESYFRKFFPAERLSLNASDPVSMPLPLVTGAMTKQLDGVCSIVVTLNPVTDKFLSQHRVQGRPTLPIVVALELMAEAVKTRTGQTDVGICTQARALQAIRFSSDDPLAVTLQTRPLDDGSIECRLLADVRRRDGRMVEEDREYFRAVFSAQSLRAPAATNPMFLRRNIAGWRPIEYVGSDGLIYHGPELQELREIADDGQIILGRIAASAPVQLFGGSRARGFTVPCSTMDACLYAVGYAAWHRHQKPSLPVRFDQIEFGRLPDPGEPCVVRIEQTHVSESGAVWDFALHGHNGDRLLTVTGYRIGWLKNS